MLLTVQKSYIARDAISKKSSNMQTLIYTGIIVCIAAYFVIYVRGIYNGTVKPVLATWLFLSLAVSISFFTDFHKTGIVGISANFFNLVDSFSVITIFIIVLFKKDTRKSFTSFEKWCVGFVTLILISWLITASDVLTHLAIQVILVVAYLPSLAKLWKAKENTEALGTWIFDCIASILGLIIPILQGDILPIIYGVRSVISTILMVIFILRIKLKNSAAHGN